MLHRLRDLWNNWSWSWVPAEQRTWVQEHLRSPGTKKTDLQTQFPELVAYLNARSWWPWRSTLRTEKCRLALELLQALNEKSNTSDQTVITKNVQQKHNALCKRFVFWRTARTGRLGRILGKPEVLHTSQDERRADQAHSIA